MKRGDTPPTMEEVDPGELQAAEPDGNSKQNSSKFSHRLFYILRKKGVPIGTL